MLSWYGVGGWCIKAPSATAAAFITTCPFGACCPRLHSHQIQHYNENAAVPIHFQRKFLGSSCRWRIHQPLSPLTPLVAEVEPGSAVQSVLRCSCQSRVLVISHRRNTPPPSCFRTNPAMKYCRIVLLLCSGVSLWKMLLAVPKLWWFHRTSQCRQKRCTMIKMNKKTSFSLSCQIWCDFSCTLSSLAC